MISQEVLNRINPYIEVCKNIGAKYNIEPALLLAIIVQESAGIKGAIRFEPHYRWIWKAPEHAQKLKISLETEEEIQKFSFGLTQIMLANARWLGFDGYPDELYQPVENITWGACFLSLLHQRHSSLSDIIASYNAGSPRKNPDGTYRNQHYVNKVLENYNYFKGFLDA